VAEIQATRIQPISEGLVQELLKAFPAPSINRPDFDRDKILWQAAQHEVVQWIIAKAPRRQ